LPRQKIDYKPKSGPIYMPVGVGFVGIELPSIENIAFGATTADEVGNMSDHEYHLVMVVAGTAKLASIEVFISLYKQVPSGRVWSTFSKRWCRTARAILGN